jgi:hypothetical protein
LTYTASILAFGNILKPHLDRLSAAFLHLARYRTRENLKPLGAARCGFCSGLVPLALTAKSLRHKGDIFAYGCGI